jgi:hypothetical protein
MNFGRIQFITRSLQRPALRENVRMLGNVGHIKGRLRAVDVKGRKMRVSLR